VRSTGAVVWFACAALGCDAAGAAARGTRQQDAGVAAAIVPAVNASAPSDPRTIVTRAPPGFLKGQLHAHTGNSGDSRTDPAEAAAWYAGRGYGFVVFTDHNVVTEVAPPPGMLVIRGVELTQNRRTCDPPPRPGEACLLHVNALFVRPQRERITFPFDGVVRRVDMYGRALDRARALGGIAQLNHPNFHHGADLELLMTLASRGLALVEIANEAIDSENGGDATTPSTEALWDAALSRGARVFGTATDDAHHYGDAERVRARGETAYTGDRGFVVVRAEKTPEAIRAAIAAGDFYASTGVILERLEMGPEGIALDTREPCTFEVIADGRVVETAHGRALRHDPRRFPAAWRRVRVTDAAGRRAFTQPAWSR
jgi:hypothetical protein